MAAFLANVGVNSSHRLRSLIHSDGGFTLQPIPEAGEWATPMLRYADCRLGSPPAWIGRPVHLDPDLESSDPTYGDNCRRAGRAYSLWHAAPGDAIAFLARLWCGDQAGFYLVGRLTIADVLPDVTADPGPGWWDRNAHIRRGRARNQWDAFWVFRGGRGSGYLPAAVPFDREAAHQVFGEWSWGVRRTELQTIGSHTRSIRRLTGGAEAALRSLVDA